jgi:hypothetical protein
MRRIIIIFSLLMLAGSLTATGNKKWEARLNLAGLFPADSGYRDTYGKTVFLPRLELGYNLSKNLGAWVGFSLLNKKGQGSLTGIPTNSSQQYLTLGFFYKLELTDRTTLRLAAAPMLGFYKEEAGIWKVSGNTIGVDLNAAFCWALANTLDIEGRLGYMSASDDSDFGETFKLGGFWAGAGINFHF